jgi:hypothetical protein
MANIDFIFTSDRSRLLFFSFSSSRSIFFLCCLSKESPWASFLFSTARRYYINGITIRTSKKVQAGKQSVNFSAQVQCIDTDHKRDCFLFIKLHMKSENTLMRHSFSFLATKCNIKLDKHVERNYRWSSLIPSIFLCSFNNILSTAQAIWHEMGSNRTATKKKY